jgi:hypothetical protein
VTSLLYDAFVCDEHFIIHLCYRNSAQDEIFIVTVSAVHFKAQWHLLALGLWTEWLMNVFWVGC